ncbi:MAG: cobinamide kinase [Hungatella sp.]|nr:cobinamide kinase [Hungatella sp.]
MMILVIGGSGSGKSSYAEKIVVCLSRGMIPSGENFSDINMKRYYLATMQIFDEEGYQKAERHRKLRSKKEFLTIEQPTQIHRALEEMEPGRKIGLLECISNLTANEMFSDKGNRPQMKVVESIVTSVKQLKEQMTHLVVVTNNVFEDGIFYDEATLEYIRAMGKINQLLAILADQVIEVVAGFPVIIKEQQGD